MGPSRFGVASQSVQSPTTSISPNKATHGLRRPPLSATAPRIGLPMATITPAKAAAYPHAA
jgi:hypothetical protein